MCSINFILEKTKDKGDFAIAQMNKATQHRGPDANGLYSQAIGDNYAFFGHNRLKINDLSDNANQPMLSADGRYCLVFNGEIYNHETLKQRLKLFKIHWKTHSDTEVLLHLLIAFGADILPELNGMFAFVFTDFQQKQILVARDRFGMKPLFLAETPSAILISSELQGILAAGYLKEQPNSTQIAHYLRYKYADSPQTFYQDIQELPIGTWRFWSRNEWSQGSFVPPAPASLELEPYEMVARTEKLLTDAIARHYAADVPVGLMLSGGVDSTLLLALCAEMGYREMPAFGVFAQTPDSNFGTEDYLFAPRAAKQFGATWHEIALSDDILNDTDDIVRALGQPIADGAAFSSYFLAKEAKPFATVLFSGAGADELFAGYNRHQAFYQYLRYLKNFPWDFLKKINKPLPDGYEHPLRKKFRLINKFVEQTDHNPRQTFLNFTAMTGFDGSFLRQEKRGEERHLTEYQVSNEEYLHFALQHEQQNYLPFDVLALTDRMAMQHGVEVRMPYLDRELIGYLALIPPEKLFANTQKWLLKDLLNKRKGQVYTQRAKEGFGLPIGQWLRMEKYKYLIDSILDTKHSLYEFLVYEKVQQLVTAHLSHKADYTQELVALLILFRWWKW